MRKNKCRGSSFPRNQMRPFKELMCNEMVRRYFISDVLEIPLEKIKEVRLENTFLSRREKQGILEHSQSVRRSG